MSGENAECAWAQTVGGDALDGGRCYDPRIMATHPGESWEQMEICLSWREMP